MDVESGWPAACLGGAATPPMAHQETRSGPGVGGRLHRLRPEEWAAARLWGGPAAEIEILEISVGGPDGEMRGVGLFFRDSRSVATLASSRDD